MNIFLSLGYGHLIRFTSKRCKSKLLWFWGEGDCVWECCLQPSVFLRFSFIASNLCSSHFQNSLWTCTLLEPQTHTLHILTAVFSEHLQTSAPLYPILEGLWNQTIKEQQRMLGCFDPIRRYSRVQGKTCLSSFSVFLHNTMPFLHLSGSAGSQCFLSILTHCVFV